MITMMITRDDDKGDDKKLKGQSKDEFKMFKRNQEQFKT